MLRDLIRVGIQLGINLEALKFQMALLSGDLVPVEIDGEMFTYRREQLEDASDLVRVVPLDSDQAAFWLDRAEAFGRECKRMLATKDRLEGPVAEIGEECGLWHSDCDCSLCVVDGPVGTVIGNLKTHWILDRERNAEVYFQHTPRPRRGPYVFRHTPAGLVPKDRGQRRIQALESIERLLQGGVAQAQHGRPMGSGGADWESIVELVDLQADEGIAKQESFRSIAELTNYPIETVRRSYFRQRARAPRSE